MRYLVCLIIGLGIGALAANTLVRVLAARDVWPRSIMQVMQHEFASAQGAVRGGRCGDDVIKPLVAHLDLLAGDIEPAVQPATKTDRVFAGYVRDLHAAIGAAAASSAACPARQHALKTIGDACERCHRDYR